MHQKSASEKVNLFNAPILIQKLFSACARSVSAQTIRPGGFEQGGERIKEQRQLMRHCRGDNVHLAQTSEKSERT
jgi:hypothetical protein